MKILFSAAVNFKMINKTRSVDSRGSLEYSRADSLLNKQKMERSKLGGMGGESSVPMCTRKIDSITKATYDLSECFVSFSGLHLPLSVLLPHLRNQTCPMFSTPHVVPLHDSSRPYVANCTCLMPCLTHLKHINPPPNPSSVSWLLSRRQLPGIIQAISLQWVFSSGPFS